MSEDEIKALQEREQAILEQLAEIQKLRKEIENRERAKLEEARLAELRKRPVEIVVVTWDSDKQKVFFKNDYREDFIKHLQTFTDRQYNGVSNSMSRNSFLTLMGELIENKDGQFDNVTLSPASADAFKIILENVRKPDYVIELVKSQLSAKINNNAPANPLYGIPGAKWSYDSQTYTIPLTEGWRLYERLKSDENKKYNVEWSTEALEHCLKQAEKRNNLATLLTAHDAEIDGMFNNGHKLRPFQRVGVAFAEALDGRWICGDEMGLGKTWQAVAYAWRQHQEAIKEGKVFKTFICCPANLKINWLREIRSLTGLEPYVLNGREPSTTDLVRMLKGDRVFYIINYDILSSKHEIETKEIDDKGVITRGKEVIWPWVDAIIKCDFNFGVFDEAHYLKNVDSLRSQAGRKLTDVPHIMLATGTPIVNRVDELWPLLHIWNSEIFPSQSLFCGQYSSDGKYVRNIQDLREMLKFIMIRRLKKDVVKDLPPINNVVKYHELSKKAQRIYEKALQGIFEVMSEWNPNEAGAEKSIPSFLAQITRLKQIVSIDKASMVADLAVELYDEAEEDEPNKKVIIFTQYRATARAIHKRLGAESVMFSGDIQAVDRMPIVDEFQNNDKIHFLVATVATAQEGLNLTRAGHVVFADLGWTPKEHQQAIGRAYGRLSNLHGVDAFWCIAGDTIEDWIWELLHQKMELIGQVVDGKEITGDESVAGELLRKMRDELFTRKKK